MLKDKRPRPLLLVGLLFAVGFVLFIVFPEPLAAEISLEPQWCVAFADARVEPEANPAAALGFRSSRHFGYFFEDASFLRLSPLQGGAAVSDAAWLVWPGTDVAAPALFDRAGQSLATLPAGHIPFFYNTSLFSVSPDALELHHYDQAGQARWSYVLPAHVSAFDHGTSLTAVGFLDGSIEVIDPSGRQQLRFSPGGSRLEVILGLGVTDDGSYIASLSGLDPQRLVVLGKGEGGYRVISHRYMETSFRTPSSVAILPDDPYVVYRDAGGIGIGALDGSFTGLLPAEVETFSLHRAHHHGIYYLVVRHGRQAELISFKPPARLLGRSRLPDGAEFVHFIDDVMYFACDDGLAKVRIGER